MFVPTWFYQLNQTMRGSLRFRLFLLISLSIFLGTFLLIHSIITQQPHEVMVVCIIAVSLELIEKDSRIGKQHKQLVLSE